MSKSKIGYLNIIFIGLAAILLCGCGGNETALTIVTAAPAVTPTFAPTATAPATPTLAPTATPFRAPTVTPRPTTLPPTSTPQPAPTPTTTARPSAIPAPSPAIGATPTSADIAPVTPRSEVKLNLKTIYYEVEGSNAAEIQAQMDKLGPLDDSGKRFYGKTDGEFRWRWAYSEKNGQCRLESLETELDVNITMPRWKTPPTAPADLVNTWSRFYNALQFHEDGHKYINIGLANQFTVEVKALPGFATCDELKKAVEEAGQRLKNNASQQNSLYDQRTQNGRTQGAVFP